MPYNLLSMRYVKLANLTNTLGQPILHQPKIQIVLALKRRIDLDLQLVEEEIWREPLYMIRFHASEIFAENE